MRRRSSDRCSPTHSEPSEFGWGGEGGGTYRETGADAGVDGGRVGEQAFLGCFPEEGPMRLVEASWGQRWGGGSDESARSWTGPSRRRRRCRRSRCQCGRQSAGGLEASVREGREGGEIAR